MKFEDAKYEPKMETYYTVKRPPVGDGASSASNYPDISSGSSTPDQSVRVESTQRPTIKRQKVHVSKLHPAIKSREVFITAITDPKTFHVQDVDFKERSEQLTRLCNECAYERAKTKIPSIDVDEMYLVFENNKNEWNRGIVTEKKKTFTVYLVDHGRNVSVTANQ